MPDQATLNHAALVLAGISPEKRADTALRFYFEKHRYLGARERRGLSHAIFAYFRWLSWLADLPASVHLTTLWPGGFNGNLMLLVPILATLALLGGLVVYLASGKQ